MKPRYHRHSVSMADRLYLRVQAYARSKGWSTSGLVTELLTRYLDEKGAPRIDDETLQAHRQRRCANGREVRDPFDRRERGATA